MARPTPDTRTRKTRLLVIAAITGVILAVLVAVGVYGLIIGPPEPRPYAPGPAPTATDGPGERRAPDELEPLAATDDPEQFAETVAHALFAWDTYTTLTVNDHRQRLVEVADPTGAETPGLLSDLDGYLPSPETWTALQEYRTRQWLDIENLAVPDQWDDALAAGGDAITEGTIAYTVTGTRHREGLWHGEAVTSEHEVAFTIFLTCPPATDDSGSDDGDAGEPEPCHLLRLSVLDQPLR